MKIKNTIKLAFKDLGRNKRNAILSSIGIAIGIFLIVLMVSFGEGVKGKLSDSIKKMTSLNLINVFSPYEDFGICINEQCENLEESKPTKEISKEDEEKIKNFPEVKYVWRPYKFNVEYSFKDKVIDFFSLSTFPKEAFGFEKIVNLSAGKPYQNDKEIIIEEDVLRQLGFEDPKEAIGKEIVVKPYIIDEGMLEEYYEEIPKEAKKYYFEQNFKIVGVSKSSFLSMGENNLIDVSLGEKIYQEYLRVKPKDELDNSLYSLNVLVKDPKDVKPVSEKIKVMGYEAESADSAIEMVNKGFKVGNTILSIFGFVVLIASALGISNTMYILILQRKREIGIMKAIGAKNKDILSIYLFEAILIGIFGAIIGIFFAWIVGQGLSFGITEIVKSQMGSLSFVSNIEGRIISPYISPQLFFGAILIAIFFSALAAQRPARGASKIPPVDALRYE